MALQELLWFIFVDELIAAILIPINQSYVLDSAVLMRSKDIIFFIYAISGAITGIIINYSLGRFFAASFKISLTIKKKQTIFLYMSLILTIIDIYGTAISFLCGIGKLKLRNFIIYVIIINICYFVVKYLFNY